MPRLAEAVRALPMRAELLVTEAYPGAPAHAVLLVRPDGHLAAALGGVRVPALHAAAAAVCGGTPRPSRPDTDAPAACPGGGKPEGTSRRGTGRPGGKLDDTGGPRGAGPVHAGPVHAGPVDSGPVRVDSAVADPYPVAGSAGTLRAVADGL